MPPTTETEIKEIRDLVIGLREEMWLGFANNNTKLVELKAELKEEIQRVEVKTDTKLAEIKEELQRVEAKVGVLEERTKIGFWGFIGRSVIIGILILLSGFAVRYVLFGTVQV
jgi:membrane-bound ClpP family serine protease